jgi:transposase-like protein
MSKKRNRHTEEFKREAVRLMLSRGERTVGDVAKSVGVTGEELTNRVAFLTRDAARSSVFEYIEAFYNRVRRHSTISYRSPINFELAASTAQAA